MAEWLVRLIGHDLDLAALTREFSENTLAVIKDEHGFWLRSSEFTALAEANDVLVRARAFLAIINGAGKVFLSGYQAVEASNVVQIGDDGLRRNFVFLEASIKSRSSVSAEVTLSGGTPAPQPAPPKDTTFAAIVAQAEVYVRRALAFFDRDHSWVNLYKVYELIRADVGGEMFIKGWTTKGEANRFTQTANSAGAVGDDARHAVEDTQPPKKPMALSEAEQFVRSLLAAWIRSKR
jgi:hypothetical protein